MDVVDLKRVGKRYGVTAVILTLSAYVLSRLADPSEVVATFANADPLPYLVGILFFYLTFPIRAVRWRVLLDGVDVDADVRSATIIILLNWFLNTLLPMKAGDFHRSVLTQKNYGTTKATALGTIAAERVVDLAVLATGLLVAMLVVIPQFTEFEFRIVLLAFGLLVVLGVGMLVIVFLDVSYLPGVMTGIVSNFRTGLMAITSAREIGVIVAITVAMWGLNVVRMGFVARSVGFDIALPMLVLIALLVAFLSGLPYTPAGIGVVEVVTTSVLVVGTGVSESTGLTFILFDRLITVGSLVVVGALVYTHFKLTSNLRFLADVESDPGSDHEPDRTAETDS
ncbi:MAG: lysylphosphatidylglycerol synthase transmembrane domain-containing protein [Halobacteriales archaeon]